MYHKPNSDPFRMPVLFVHNKQKRTRRRLVKIKWLKFLNQSSQLLPSAFSQAVKQNTGSTIFSAELLLTLRNGLCLKHKDTLPSACMRPQLIFSSHYYKYGGYFISVFNQLDAQNLFHNYFYVMPLHVSSTCAHHQAVKIALHSLWYHHSYR